MNTSENVYANDIHSIKSMLEKMNERQLIMDEMMRDMDKNLIKITDTVVGNPTYGQKGLIVELGEVKKYVDKDKLVKNKIQGALVVIGIVWTLLLQYLNHFFNGKS